jgi:hypothetical protein
LALALRHRNWRIDLASIFRQGWVLRTAIVLGCLGLGFLGGYALPIFGTLSLMGVGGILGMIALPLIWLLATGRQMDVVFIILTMVMLLQDLPQKLFGTSVASATQILLIFLAPIGFPNYIKASRDNKVLMTANMLFIAYMIIGLSSTYLGRSTTLAATYQFISNLKPFFIIILGYALAWRQPTEKIFLTILRWAWVPMVLLSLFEWAAPSVYSSVFSMGGLVPQSSTDALPRATGLFSFPGTLAANASMIAILFLVRGLHARQGDKPAEYFTAAAYGSCIVFALSKGEMIAFTACTFMILALYKKDGRTLRILMATTLIALAVPAFYMFFGESIEAELNRAGVTRAIGPIDHPRLQIFTLGFHLANKYWPLGAGLGTYAGAGAEKFDDTVYESLGFSSFWWYGKQDFLMDTYWPNPIAEAGYFGAILLFLSYIFVFLYAAKRWLKGSRHSAPYWATAASGILFSLINSISTPAFMETRTYFFVAIFFGLAYLTELRERHAGIADDDVSTTIPAPLYGA